MKLGDIRDLGQMPPQQRAVQCLELGEEMMAKRRRPAPMGKLPPPLRRETVRETAVGPLMMRLHGVRGALPELAKGLRETGRRLKTKAGEVADLVLTPQARKKVVETSFKQRGKDKSLTDLAVRQLALSMFDNDPLARCCAAYAYWQATGAEAAVPVLANAQESRDNEDERILAAYCLAKMETPQAKRLQGTAKDDRPQTPPEPVLNSMTIIIHGTFAKDSDWYQPGGDFHAYIKNEVYPDVYADPDFYFWSGRYALSESGLENIWRQAARKLVSWIKAHPANTLRIIAHSHGNNVVNMATKLQPDLLACSLIQLSPPVHKSNLPDMGKVSSDTLFNMHSTVDLVVTVDGGAQDYRGTSVASSEKRKIISSFGHSDSHDPKFWKKKNIPALVKTVCQ
jgi:hypothetical protein